MGVYVGDKRYAPYVGNKRRVVAKVAEDEIIMTSTSNPEVMAICYSNGWASNADYMTKSEAEVVTSFGTAFRSSNISHFEELSYLSAVTSIADNAFRECTSLVSMLIPSNITSIGSRALLGCTSLTKVELMGNVASIGASCFRNSSNLTVVIFHSSTPPTFGDTAAFNSTNLRNGGIYVPDDSVDAYKSRLGSPYGTWVKPISEYTE